MGRTCNKAVKIIADNLRQPAVRAMLYACLVLIVPEFLAPLAAIFSLIAAIRDRRGEKNRLLGGTLLLFLALYVLYMIVGMLWSGDAFSTLQSVMMWLSMGGIYFSLCTVLRDRSRLDRFLFILSVTMGICGLVAVIQHILNAYFHLPIDMQVWRWLDVLISKIVPYKVCDNFDGRAAAFFANPNVFAYSFMMLMPFAMYFAFSRKRDIPHTLGAIFLVLSFFGGLFTFSRGAYISMIFVVLLFVAFHIKRLRLILMIAAVVLMLIPASVYGRLFSIGDSNEFIHNVTDKIISSVTDDGNGNIFEDIMSAIKDSDGENMMDGAVLDRFDGWAASMNSIEKKPMFGYGAGYRNIYYVLHEQGTPNYHAHNLVLQLLLEGGVTGLILMMMIGVAVVRRGAVLLHKKSGHPQMGLATVAFAVGFVISGMTDFILLTPKQMGCFFIALGLCEVMASLYTGYEMQPAEKILASPVKKLFFGKESENENSRDKT